MKYTVNKKTKWKLNTIDIALIGVMVATLEAAKFSLSFLPNIELVTLLIILYTLFLERKAYIAVFAFVGIECLVWGMGIWIIMYLYIWPLLVLLTRIFHNQKSVWFWCVLSGIYGLLFGALCAIPYFFIGGIHMAFTWWVSGIPYDVIHCVSNFVLCLILFIPLNKVMNKMKYKDICRIKDDSKSY